MDLTKSNLRFSLALALALCFALYPSANATAGGKIYQSVDSNGRVTYTDVPLLLDPHVKRGFKGTAKVREIDGASQSQNATCSPSKPSSKRHCQHKPD